MSTTPAETRSSASRRTRRHRERRRQGTRCVTVDVSQGELDALVVRGYLAEETRGEHAAIKAANRKRNLRYGLRARAGNICEERTSSLRVFGGTRHATSK